MNVPYQRPVSSNVLSRVVSSTRSNSILRVTDNPSRSEPDLATLFHLIQRRTMLPCTTWYRQRCGRGKSTVSPLDPPIVALVTIRDFSPHGVVFVVPFAHLG